MDLIFQIAAGVFLGGAALSITNTLLSVLIDWINDRIDTGPRRDWPD